MKLADQLRQAIKRSGQPLYRISKGTRIAYPGLHRFYTGKKDIRLATADRLIRFLKLELVPKGRKRA